MFLSDLELRRLRCMITSKLQVDSDRLETSFTVFGKTNLNLYEARMCVRVCMCIVYMYLIPEMRILEIWSIPC